MLFPCRTSAPPAFGTGSITFGTPATQTQPNFGLNPAQPATGSFQYGATTTTTSTAAPSLFGAQPALNFNKPTGFATPTPQTALFGATPISTSGLQFGK